MTKPSQLEGLNGSSRRMTYLKQCQLSISVLLCVIDLLHKLLVPFAGIRSSVILCPPMASMTTTLSIRPNSCSDQFRYLIWVIFQRVFFVWVRSHYQVHVDLEGLKLFAKVGIAVSGELIRKTAETFGEGVTPFVTL